MGRASECLHAFAARKSAAAMRTCLQRGLWTRRDPLPGRPEEQKNGLGAYSSLKCRREPKAASPIRTANGEGSVMATSVSMHQCTRLMKYSASALTSVWEKGVGRSGEARESWREAVGKETLPIREANPALSIYTSIPGAVQKGGTQEE